MPKPRKNFAAFRDALGIVHPIRSGQQKVATKRGPKLIEARTGYNEFRAGDFDDPATRKRKREQYEDRKDRAYFEGLKRDPKVKREMRRATKSLGTNLAKFVRQKGGIASGRNEVYSGELARLSPKQLGTTGLLNRNNRKAGRLVTADTMRELAEQEGFGHFDSVGAFLDAVEDDATGRRKAFSMTNPKRKTNRAASRRASGEAPLFSSYAVAQAKPVTKLSRVQREDTGTEGRVVSRSGDWFKVKFSGYDRPHFVKKDALIFLNPSGAVRLKLGAKKATTKPNGLFGRVVAKRKLRKHLKRAATAKVDAMLAAEELRAARKSKRNPEITPARAKQLLKTNVGNRPIDSKKVNAIASVMKRGIFKRVKPLVFTNGILTDGQHTLLALVKAGVPVRMKISHKRVKPNPLFADILGGFAGGAGYAIASHVTAKHLEKKRRTRRGGGAVTDATIINPSKRAKRAKKNPIRKAKLAQMFKEFRGFDSSKQAQVAKSTTVPNGTFEIGTLKELPLMGQTIKMPSGCFLAGDASENLHITRRLQNGRAVPPFKPNQTNGASVKWIDEVKKFPYGAVKVHIGGNTFYLWVHKAGEEGGARPVFGIDRDGYPVLRGGDYEIRPEGIVN